MESQNVLYHYTSLASLLKIVQSKHLWASEIHYLNDHGEMLAGVDAIERTILDEVEGSQKNRGLLDAIHDTIGRIEHHNVFVGSFSQNGDLLSQWRAYCTPCEGVSIGIDARELADASAQAGFQLRRCIYDEATLCIEVKRLLSELVADLDRVGLSANVDHPVAQKRIRTFTEAIILVAACFKDSGFAEECEWRVISPPLPITDGSVLYRQGRSLLIPYLELALPLLDGEIAISRCVAGPCPHPTLTSQALRGMFAGRGIQTSVAMSRIAYRAW